MFGKKTVVDRAGLSYSCRIKPLAMANPHFRIAEMRRFPKLMANLFGLERDANLAPALTTNAIEVRHG